jgi:GntR family transcriptional repressor for pyruvate dehydrogenase complex
MAFKRIKKIRLYEEVADQIQNAIFDGELKPGDSLLSERELCKTFGVGRQAVREALRTLSVMGLIEIAPGAKGTVVKEIGITQYMEAVREQLSLLYRVEKKTIIDLMEVRKYIELGISQLVAQNADEAEIEDLEHLIGEMEACNHDIHAYFPLGVEFHRKLALATKNQVFYLIWNILYDILLKGYTPILDELFPEGPSKLIKLNKDVLKAIKSKDPKKIDRAMESHAEKEKFDPLILVDGKREMTMSHFQNNIKKEEES